jgi:hypothetical protein
MCIAISYAKKLDEMKRKNASVMVSGIDGIGTSVSVVLYVFPVILNMYSA